MNIQTNYSEILDKLEDTIEDDFNEIEIENYAYSLNRKLRKNWDILRLASIMRWADFKEEERGVDIAQNIVDKAVEQAVSSNNIEELKERLNGWQREAFEASYKSKQDSGLSLIKKKLLETRNS